MLIEKQYEPVLPNGWYEAMGITYKDREVNGTLVTDLEWQILSGEYKEKKVRQTFWHDANSASIRTLTRLYDAVIDANSPSIDPRAFLDKVAYYKIKKVALKDGREKNFVIDASLKQPGTIEKVLNPIAPTPSILEARPPASTPGQEAAIQTPTSAQNRDIQQGAPQGQVVASQGQPQGSNGLSALQQELASPLLPEDAVPF